MSEEAREIRAVAHELKTPMAIVYGYATTLLQQDLPEPTRRWFLRVIAEQSLRLIQSVDHLENLTRLDGAIDAEPVDLAAACRDAAERARAAFPDTIFEIDQVSGPGALAAPEWVELALEHALGACASAAGEGGHVRTAAPQANGDSVRMRMDITPPAMPAGLGVYVARRILERLGGSLEERRGGLTFLLPAAV